MANDETRPSMVHKPLPVEDRTADCTDFDRGDHPAHVTAPGTCRRIVWRKTASDAIANSLPFSQSAMSSSSEETAPTSFPLMTVYRESGGPTRPVDVRRYSGPSDLVRTASLAEGSCDLPWSRVFGRSCRRPLTGPANSCLRRRERSQCNNRMFPDRRLLRTFIRQLASLYA
jgi:hypothetical protein